MRYPGFFISFEGGEGSGKSTQITLLQEKLARYDSDTNILITREPGGTPEAEMLREIFVNPDKGQWSATELALLVMTARAHHLRKLVIPHLEKGGIVLCDRFVDSTRVYQGYATELDDQLIRDMHKNYAYDLWPDLTFLLDIPVEEGFKRVHSRGGAEATQRFEGYDQSFHQDLRDGFLSCAAQEPKRIQTIDAMQDIDSIAAQIWTITQERLP